MWNKVSSNKHLQKLSKQQAYRRHIITLYKMKSTLNNKAPVQYQFLKHKPKTQLKKKQRQDQIQKTNNILVDRMIQNGSNIRSSNAYFKESLNSKIIKQKQRQIDIQNQRLVNKIKAVNSQYSKNKLQKNMSQYDRLKSSMAFSRMHQTYNLLDYQPQIKAKLKLHSHRPRTAKH